MRPYKEKGEKREERIKWGSKKKTAIKNIKTGKMSLFKNTF